MEDAFNPKNTLLVYTFLSFHPFVCVNYINLRFVIDFSV